MRTGKGYHGKDKTDKQQRGDGIVTTDGIGDRITGHTIAASADLWMQQGVVAEESLPVILRK